MKRTLQTLCMLLAANWAAACGGSGPNGDAPGAGREIFLWPEGNMPSVTAYEVNNGSY